MRSCANSGCAGSMEGKKSSAKACSVVCNQAILLARRTAAKWEGVDPDRPCEGCQKPMTGMRPHAVYCSRICKTAASERRRVQDGRDNSRKHIRRAANVGIVVTDREWRRLIHRHGGRCFYCGKKSKMTKDHVIPVTRGGIHSLGNILPACQPCNSSKADRFIMEWRLGRKLNRCAP